MRKTFCHILALGFAAAFAFTSTGAQDLSQLAKKTREERLKTKMQRSVRVWTNDNMPKRPPGEGPTAAAGMSAAAPPDYPGATEPEPPPGPDPAEPLAEAETSAIDSLRAQIKQAKQRLTGLEERQRLAEDELSLLQVQQATELAPNTQSTLAAKIKEKNGAISTRRQEMDKTKKEIETLEKDLKARGGTLEEKKESSTPLRNSSSYSGIRIASQSS